MKQIPQLKSHKLQLGQRIGDWTITNENLVLKDRRYQIQVTCKCGYQAIIRIDRFKKNIHSCCKNCADKEKLAIPRKNYKELSARYWNDIKHGAKMRNLEFSLSKEFVYDLLEKQNFKCALSGINIKLSKSRTASLDRIDSTKGYIENNIQWVHSWVNIMKGAMSNEEFMKICELVVNKHDNTEPSFMQGVLSRYKIKQHRKGATTRE